MSAGGVVMVVHVLLQFNYYHIIYDITFIYKNLAELEYVHNFNPQS